MDGSVIEIAIVQEQGENVNVVVLLDEIVAQQNFVFNLNENKKASVDFSSESFSNETTAQDPSQNDGSSGNSEKPSDNNYVQF